MAEPVFHYPAELPVSAARDEIVAAIRDNQVVIVAGATGSGKTTQLPKMLLELGRNSIAHTQPRRLAARTIAERIAEELEVPLGSTVGYKVRFTDKVSAETKIALMTDGILLNEIHRDRLLKKYDTIIIDEAHERSLNVDFLLGYLKQLLPKRPDLKVIITSATIDPQSFAEHFGLPGRPAPIIEVSGRTYPVEVRYRAQTTQTSAQGDANQRKGSPAADFGTQDEVDRIVAALQELDREAPGDVLVFLPGEAEIRDAADAVRSAYQNCPRPVEVLPLYGRLSAAEQHRVFEPSRVAGVSRRVILATNVAETSLTVPGIKYVIDTGTARVSRYSNRSSVQRLPIEAISQASANQRSGRAGRTSDGIAIRLYSEEDFESRPEFTTPEVLRTSLASVVLQMLALGFDNVARFPFLTPPDSRGVKSALELLVELGAVKQTEAGTRLTKLGREIARMPIDPRYARMLIEAERQGVSAEVRAIVAGISIQDVRERPEEVREKADALHNRFTDPTSDFITTLNLWKYLDEKQKELGSSAFRRLCRDEYLNYVRVREWFDVERQLRQFTGQRGEKRKLSGVAGTTSDAVHKSLLAGLLSHIGVLDERSITAASASKQGRAKPRKPIAEYRGARGVKFSIFPGSGLRKKTYDAVIAAEIVETSRMFGRTVAAIDPAWAEALAGDLAKRSYSEPRWSRSNGAAVISEKVTLFGLDIVPRRTVQYARLDKVAARELFIRHALVEGGWEPHGLGEKASAFWRANRNLRARLEKLEERERRRDILVGDETIYTFYDERIPADVYDARSFERWWKDTVQSKPKLLTMREDDLRDRDDRADAAEFPQRWQQRDQVLGLAYRFAPGTKDDGVSVVVPVALLAGLSDDGFDWHVPGLRSELITALLRALPKAIRRHVVPAADWADKFAAELTGSGPEDRAGVPEQSLVEALARRITPLANQVVKGSDFQLDRVPEHLLMNFRVIDEHGKTLGTGRNLPELQKRLAAKARGAVSSVVAPPSQSSKPPGPSAGSGTGSVLPTGSGQPTKEWTFDTLPEMVDTRVAGGIVRGYPAIVDSGTDVSVQVEATLDDAIAATRQGILRLVLLAVPSPASYVQEHLTQQEKLALAASPYHNVASLIEDARTAVARAIIDRETDGTGIVRTRDEFERVRDAVSAELVDELFKTVSLTAGILTKQREIERALKQANSIALLGPLGDIRSQLSNLVFPGFIAKIGTARLQHIPRYLAGILMRLNTLQNEPGKDRTRQSEFERAAAMYTDASGTLPLPVDPMLTAARWLLEEYRISLFAQQLGTAEPVSLQRITKALAR